MHFSSSPGFAAWLDWQEVSLAFTTYQAGKLFLLGRKEDGTLSIFERGFPRCMGLWTDTQSLWMSSLYQVWRFENVLGPGQVDAEGFDRVFVPMCGHTTGDIDVHDIAVDGSGQPVFANTLFSCLAGLSATHSFTPRWKPDFITRLAPEDRCHLNGLALVDGEPAYASACSATDHRHGWRDCRHDGGLVLDVRSGQTVVDGLSMPHSPRWYGDRLWLLHSGAGVLGHVEDGAFQELGFCPGYLRGLAFSGDYAIAGLSKPRYVADELAFQERLHAREEDSWCGLAVIELRSGEIVHWFRIEDGLSELYDVAVLPGVRCPKAVGFKTDEIRKIIRIG